MRLRLRLPWRRFRTSLEPTDLQQQRETLREIGSVLRTRREAQGLSIRQLASETRITTPVIEALERGWGERLPERAYLASMLPQLEQRLALPAGTLEPVLPPVSLRRGSAGPGLGRFTLGSIDVFTTWQGSVVYGLVMLLSLLVLNRQRHDLAVRNSLSFEPVSVEMTGLQDAAPDQEPAEQTQPASAASDQLPDADAGLLTFTLQESRQLQLTDGRGARLTLDAATGTISLLLQPPLELQLQPDPLSPGQVQVFWNGEPLSPEEELMGVYRIEPTKVDAPALERPQMDPLSP